VGGTRIFTIIIYITVTTVSLVVIMRIMITTTTTTTTMLSIIVPLLLLIPILHPPWPQVLGLLEGPPEDPWPLHKCLLRDMRDDRHDERAGWMDALRKQVQWDGCWIRCRESEAFGMIVLNTREGIRLACRFGQWYHGCARIVITPPVCPVTWRLRLMTGAGSEPGGGGE
jgi:hypothetical protein